jgi:ABC-2 type transport system permease protein
MEGLTALIYGFLPKAVFGLSWAAWALFAALELLWEGGVINWSVMGLSPFSYSHYTIPVSALSILTLAGLSLLAVLLAAIGLYGFNKRDILTKA